MLDANVWGKTIIDDLTLGLWDKLGTPAEISSKDCKLMARIIRNYAKIQTSSIGNGGHIFWEAMAMEQLTDGQISWFQSVADFFEHCGGIVGVNECPGNYEEWSDW